MTKKKEDSKQQKIDYKKLAEELAAENAQLNDALLRERADAMNVRKRADDERLKLAGFYKAHVIKELLPVVDNFERALKNTPEDLRDSDYIKGVQGVVRQFEQTLTKIGVERIKTVGEHFDPYTMEAVTMEDCEGDQEIVSEELQSGYTIGDEVIRHAMVRVKNA
jgi:molecular chaperone GrpE